ncbi:MAG: FAD-binding protein [Desulfobulbaceae bacterium]|nr:FAD-binding protein [Desulfobulbaceae bacterium]
MDQKTIKALKQIVSADNLRTAEEELLCYSYDGTGREFVPEAVALPGSTAEVSAIMQLASATPFPVVVRGAGTGMTGGSLPLAGGLVLAMGRMNRILEIDVANQVAVVEPGVITGDLRDEAARHQLYYPPDPASFKFCTIGGNVAECAGGPSAVKYGVTRDYVLGLEVVLPDGKIINTGVRTAKGVVGYDLTRLFVGSEGTLGVVTKIILRLVAAPATKQTLLVLLDSMERAASLVAEILARHLPCTLEYMDRTAISLVADKFPAPIPEGTAALLLIELDGDREQVEHEGQRLRAFLQAADQVLTVQAAQDATEAEQLWAARRAVSPASFTLRPHKISEDVVVPRTRIPELVATAERLAATGKIPIFTFGHAGDGNIHVNIMLDRGNPAEVTAAENAKRALFTKVIELGGTLSGEHGVGITKAAYLAMELSAETIATMQAIKRLFDPGDILNPGKIFPPPGGDEENI